MQKQSTRDNNMSADDALEQARQKYPGQTAKHTRLPRRTDTDNPARPSTNPFTENLPQDHPLTDSNIETSELYEKGVDAAAGAPLLPEPTLRDYERGEWRYFR